MKEKYIFESNRLGFRNWKNDDIHEFALINADLEVMEHFPRPLTVEETIKFVKRLRNHYDRFGYNYFATEALDNGELLGFIGLAHLDYEAEFNPATDIGWRLKRSV